MMLLYSLEKQEANCKPSVKQEIINVMVKINELETTRKCKSLINNSWVFKTLIVLTNFTKHRGIRPK